MKKENEKVTRRGFIGILAGLLTSVGLLKRSSDKPSKLKNVSEVPARYYTRGDKLAG